MNSTVTPKLDVHHITAAPDIKVKFTVKHDKWGTMREPRGCLYTSNISISPQQTGRQERKRLLGV